MKKDQLKDQVEEIQKKLKEKSEMSYNKTFDQSEAGQYQQIQHKINDLLSNKTSSQQTERVSRVHSKDDYISRKTKHTKSISIAQEKEGRYFNSKLISTDDLTIKKLIEFSCNMD